MPTTFQENGRLCIAQLAWTTYPFNFGDWLREIINFRPQNTKVCSPTKHRYRLPTLVYLKSAEKKTTKIANWTWGGGEAKERNTEKDSEPRIGLRTSRHSAASKIAARRQAVEIRTNHGQNNVAKMHVRGQNNVAEMHEHRRLTWPNLCERGQISWPKSMNMVESALTSPK